MDFNDTVEEAAFRAEARAWLDANAERLTAGERTTGLAEGRADPDLIQRAKQWQAKKADAGWACLTWPKEYGGRGATSIQNVIWNQEEGRYKVPPNVFAIGLGMLGPTIMAHGTDEQKRRYLRPMLRGEEIWCQLFSEPAAGSDLAGLRTTAVRQGDHWVINGQKIWTTGAQYCKWGMVVTRTDPDRRKHKGITYFIVDMEAPGIEIRPIKQINGPSGFNEVFFTDVRVPDTNRIGAVNEGWRGAITTLMNERASIGGGAWVASTSEIWCSSPRRRPGTGEPPWTMPPCASAWRASTSALKGLQYTGYRIQTALSQGRVPGPEASIGKLVGAPLRQEMASFAIDLQGPAGAIDGQDRGGAGGGSGSSAISARPACASPAARTRSCATSSPSACSACRRRFAPTRAFPSRTFRPAPRTSRSGPGATRLRPAQAIALRQVPADQAGHAEDDLARPFCQGECQRQIGR